MLNQELTNYSLMIAQLLDIFKGNVPGEDLINLACHLRSALSRTNHPPQLGPSSWALIEILPPSTKRASWAAPVLDGAVERARQGPEGGAVATGNAANAAGAVAPEAPAFATQTFCGPCCRVRFGLLPTPGLLRRGPGGWRRTSARRRAGAEIRERRRCQFRPGSGFPAAPPPGRARLSVPRRVGGQKPVAGRAGGERGHCRGEAGAGAERPQHSEVKGGRGVGRRRTDPREPLPSREADLFGHAAQRACLPVRCGPGSSAPHPKGAPPGPSPSAPRGRSRAPG